MCEEFESLSPAVDDARAGFYHVVTYWDVHGVSPFGLAWVACGGREAWVASSRILARSQSASSGVKQVWVMVPSLVVGDVVELAFAYDVEEPGEPGGLDD